MNLLIVILGPTASGKSQLALRLVQRFNGEIVSADSRQVYRYMDIGTAKPTPQEMALVPHHLTDIMNPDEDFSLAGFQRLAYRSIDDIQKRHKLPFLVGGTGQYLWAVVEGWIIPAVTPDLEFRKNLEGRSARGEGEELYQELSKIDPVAAQRIDRRNVRRVIRALEIAKQPDGSSRHLQKAASPFETLIIGLTTERKELYRRIDERVDKMIELGLVDEVKKLLEMGYGVDLPAMSGIGYKQIISHLNGELTLAEAAKQIKTATHQFVRRQYNWFRFTDTRIKWFDVQNANVEAEIEAAVAGFLKNSQ